MEKFTCLRTIESDDGQFFTKIHDLSVTELPPNDVLVKVAYSSLNFKDALSSSGNRGVTSHYPHTPGIDASGTVISDSTDSFPKGTKVIVTSYDLGMNTHGALGQLVRVPASWIVPLPTGMSLKQAMNFGTAGLTAGLSIHALQEAVTTNAKKILVTGATGGVGSLAIRILSKIGYQVTALTGKHEQSSFLKSIGAKDIILRHEFLESSKKIMLRENYDGVIDTCGGNVLATAIKSTAYNGTITTCGNIAGHDIPINVYPFILRGVNLKGIDSANCPMQLRLKIWNKLAKEWALNDHEGQKEIALAEVPEVLQKMLAGQALGHTLVKI